MTKTSLKRGGGLEIKMYTPGRPERGVGLNTFENSQKQRDRDRQTDTGHRQTEYQRQLNREMNRETEK